MNRKITAIVIMLCLVLLMMTPAVKAAGTTFFTAINDTLLPLDNSKMPVVIGNLLYIPCNFFTDDELGVYCIPGGTQAVLYNTKKQLFYDTISGNVVDQDGNEDYIAAVKKNGLIYVSVDQVCAFFGLTYDVIQSEPAPVVRFKKGSVYYYTKEAFISANKTKMQRLYDNYVGQSGSPSVTPEASPSPPAYPDISVYLSFYDVSGGGLARILETFEKIAYKACFFVTADEIEDNADLLRRAACKGHTIGIFLTDLTAESAYKEYKEASALLFEAAMVKTVIVTALGEAAAAAEDMAKGKSLVFWRPTKYYDAEAKLTVAGVTGKLSTVKGTRESLYFACSERVSGILRPLLSYLSQYEYGVRRVTETSIPVRTA